MRSPAVRDYMSQCPVLLAPDRTARDAENAMKSNGIRHIVVELGGKAVGVISFSDLHVLNSILRIELDAIMIGEVMNKELAKLRPDVPLREAAGLMARRSIGSVVVVGPDDAPVGILTASDCVRALADVLSPPETKAP
ncbi:MAG: CBS domain-containing protein [Deltaproteobacteria bacterium]|nr:CBS domain-containing protein [Deltaproteobacteria bacterium]